MAFATPIWLWALSGLAIPIGIHLLSRKEGSIIKLGSLRHLQNTTTTKFSTIRLNEYWLLLIRCLLLLWVVLFLSGLHVVTKQESKNRWLLIEKELENDSDFTELMDSLQRNNFELRFLAEDFPLLTEQPKPIKSYWSLVEALDDHKLDQVVILAFNKLNNFNGKRIPLPEHIQWISKNSSPKNYPLVAIRLPHDSIWIRNISSAADQLTLQTTRSLERNSSIKLQDSLIKNPDTLRIGIAYDEAFTHDKNILLAALQSLQQNTPVFIAIRKTTVSDWKTKSDDWVFWLSEKSKPNTMSQCIYPTKVEVPSQELFAFETSNQWVLTKRLTERVALQKNLTNQVAQLLLPVDAYNQLLANHDMRTLPEKTIWSVDTTQKKQLASLVKPNRETDIFWLILILLSVVAERLLAFKKNQ